MSESELNIRIQPRREDAPPLDDSSALEKQRLLTGVRSRGLAGQQLTPAELMLARWTFDEVIKQEDSTVAFLDLIPRTLIELKIKYGITSPINEIDEKADLNAVQKHISDKRNGKLK